MGGTGLLAEIAKVRRQQKEVRHGRVLARRRGWALGRHAHAPPQQQGVLEIWPEVCLFGYWHFYLFLFTLLISAR